MFETVVNLDLASDDLYVRHQRVAALFSRDRQAERDYQFSVGGGGLYLRSPQRRVNLDGWREMRAAEGGRRYAISGVARIDSARLAPKLRATWRLPPVLQGIVARWFDGAGAMEDLTVSPGTALPMSKPGQATLLWTPIFFTGMLLVKDQAEALRIQQQGVGRGRGFGFGCVHFQEAA